MTDEMTPQSPGQTGGAAADVEMSQYVAGRSRVNEDKIRQDDEIISQFGEYEYERDKSGQVLEGYPDINNHHIDAVRYATEPIWGRRGNQ